MTHTCQKCGFSNLDEAKFCFKCGTSLLLPPDERRNATKPKTKKTHQPTRTSFTIESVLVIFGWVCLVGSLLFLLYHLQPAIFQDISIKLPENPPNSGGQRITLREVDRLKQAAASFTDLSQIAGQIRSVSVDDLIMKGSTYSLQPVTVGGIITRKNQIENLLEKDWPSSTMLEIGGHQKTVLVLYRGYSTPMQIGDPVQVDGIYQADSKVILAYSVRALTNNPFLENWRNLWLERLTVLTVIWMFFCAAFFLWRSRRYHILSTPLAVVIILALLITFSTSACEVHITTVISADNTGFVTTTLSETTDNMNYLKQVPGMEAYLESWKLSLRNQGMQLDQAVNGGQEYLTFQRIFGSLDDFMQSNQGLKVQPTWVYVTRTQESGDTVFRYIALIDTRPFYANIPGIDPNAGSYIRQLFDQINMNYSVSLPGKVVYSNGQIGPANEVTWKLRMNDVNQVVVESRNPSTNQVIGSSFNPLIIVVILTFILFFSTLLLSIGLIRYRLPKPR